MAARSGKFLPVGMRFACVFELDADGRPKATGETPYIGLRWSGPLAFDLTFPQARIIPHRGADRVLRTAVLPTQETASGVLRVSDYRFDIQSVLTGIKTTQVGEAKEFGHLTSKQGYEPTVALMLFQQSQDLDTGLLTWHAYIIPKSRCVMQGGSMNENAGEITYQVVPTSATQRLWGKTLTLADDGYLDAGIFEYDTEGQPAVVAFLAGGTTAKFDFPAGEPAIATEKIEVYVDGIKTTEGVTPATTGVEFAVAPAEGAVIVVWYER